MQDLDDFSIAVLAFGHLYIFLNAPGPGNWYKYDWFARGVGGLVDALLVGWIVVATT